MIHIAPSVLAADFAHLGADVERVETAGATYLHLDVMDGAFVPNISFGPGVIGSLRKDSKLFFDVHLMINDPIRYIDNFVKAGADGITFHVESCTDADAIIAKIRAAGVKVGISLSPATPIDAIVPYLDKVDMVLVMTVVPGFGGQSFMADMTEKVRFAYRYAKEHALSYDIEVDGGIAPATVAAVTSAGANILVAGSAVFKAADPKAAIGDMIRIANENPYNG